jgi:hypothetical protein
MSPFISKRRVDPFKSLLEFQEIPELPLDQIFLQHAKQLGFFSSRAIVCRAWPSLLYRRFRPSKRLRPARPDIPHHRRRGQYRKCFCYWGSDHIGVLQNQGPNPCLYPIVVLWYPLCHFGSYPGTCCRYSAVSTRFENSCNGHSRELTVQWSFHPRPFQSLPTPIG